MIDALPDTALVKEATSLARGATDTLLYDHSIRTFLLGRAYGRAKGLSFDDEGLLVAALFHDLGLCSRYADPTRGFPQVGAALVDDLLCRHEQPERGAALAEAIAFHMQPFPRWSLGTDAGLLHVGAWMDAMGLRRGSLDPKLLRAIESAYPRGGAPAELTKRVVRSLRSVRACGELLFPARHPLRKSLGAG